MLKYANSAKRKRIARLASLLAIIVMIPAIWTFISVLKENRFESDAELFIKNELGALPYAEYIKKNTSYTYGGENNSVIEFNSFGLEEIPESTISLLKNRLNDYPALIGDNTKLIFNQTTNKGLDNFKYMQQLRSRDSLDLLSQSEKIIFLEKKVRELSKLEKNYIAFNELKDEIKINYETIEQFSYANLITSNFKKTDTVPVFSVKWLKSKTKEVDRKKDKEKLEKWLKLKLKLDTLVVKRLN